MNYNMDDFIDRCSKLDIILDDNKLLQYNRFYELLVEYNKVMNLTGITEYDEVLLKHYIDCLSVNICPQFKSCNNSNIKLIDVGTGAGFPGVPIKIAFPNIKVDLLDSLNKRINFLNTVITDINLKDINTFHGRAEDYAANKEFREQYDMCVSRAVANLSTLCEYCLPFIKIGGFFIALKSGNIDDEISLANNAIKVLGGTLVDVIEFQLPDTDISRSFVIIKKTASTPKKFPRKAGTPAKDPIK